MSETFESIWERKDPWPAGRGLLADIILWLEDKSLQVEMSTPTQINLHLRMPQLMPADVPLLGLFPPKIKPVFVARWQMLVVQHAATMAYDFEQHKGMAMTPFSLTLINSQLRAAEWKLKAERGKELWQEAAELFGFTFWALPAATGLRLR